MKTVLFFTLVLFVSSCILFTQLHSHTTIKPMDSFILGNNEHGAFKVVLKNVSTGDLELFHAPIAGSSRHSSQIIKPLQTIDVKVAKNTGLFIVNNTKDTANVEMKVSGDTGLSMGYKN